MAGPYRWDAYDIRAYGVETNRFGTGSYRGPGGPQASFALESLMDELAAKLGIDPLDLRMRNAVTPGDRMVDGEAWVRIGTREVLQEIQDHPLWQGRAGLPDGEAVGIAVGVWPGGREPAAAVCRLEPDGSITIITGVVDMSGVASGFATIAAEAFGVSVEKVQVIATDTYSAPRSPMSGGSVVTYSSGRAVQKAVEATREKLLRYASEELEIEPSDLEIVDGQVQPKGAPGRGKSVAELAEKLDGFGGAFEPVEGHAGALPPSLAPSVSAHLAHVRVDRETGEVKVLEVRHRAGRRSGAQPRAHRRPDARRRGAGHRLGTARGDAVRRPGPAALGLPRWTTRSPSPATCRRSRRSSSRCPPPTARTAPRASARRPSAAAPLRSPMPSRTRSASGSIGCR